MTEDVGILRDEGSYHAELDRLRRELDPSDFPNTEEIVKILLSRHTRPDLFELLNLYYFQLRGSYVFFGEWEIEKANEGMKLLRETVQYEAARLTVLHQRWGRPFMPSWIEDTRQILLGMISGSYPEASGVQITLDQVPRVQCRASKEGKIRVSALTREFYVHFNLVILRWVADYTDPPTFSEMCRMMLPYLLQMNDRIPFSRLPQLSTPSRQTAEEAFTIADLQMLFLLAHEYGHLHLDHPNRPRGGKEEALAWEFAADQFAFLHVGRGCNQYGVDHFYMGIRWLFQIQQIDEIVGAILRGQDYDFEDLIFQQRKNELYTLYQYVNGPTVEGNTRECLGTGQLMTFKAGLRSLSTEDLRQIADELSYDLNEREPTKWWEKLDEFLHPDAGTN
jgi:hypothetical protein